ncbi:restriction endonuclease subunit S [Brevibacterium luteolum]|uniref:restriction endonuclease subunit S n=1 Tax=Brevibacterium luteolum TaxID=199591 RepID=UPI00223AF74F|nr:hypothetical protein [Brevibacterium luteolum]MCT1873964.1 hypothetical protein [Brevibacterium luteolum]MCT1891254.1 hypothetical protein [Brevibacterium luteolum]MCT1893847.1 hypothetical protein [Brevibacterium luteolum]MCT1924686.1 hypothetical protein [Brevibacterium luteolum]
MTATKDLHLLKLVEVGDFVISLRSFQGGIERCHHRGIISPAYTVLKAKSDDYREYLTYLFKSVPFVDSLTLAITGIREGQNIDFATLAVDQLPVPTPEEQVAIAKYLAHANTRIDKAIAAKRRLIALLEEQKIAVASDEIDGLVGPRVPLKRVLRSITAGVWGAAPEESDDEPRWCVRVADFDYGPGRVKLHPKTMRSIADLDFARKRLDYGDLLLEGSGGGDKTSVGRVVVFDHTDPAVCSNFLQRLRPAAGVDSEYLALVLRGLHAAGTVRLHIKQTTGIQNLDLGSFLTTEIPLPVESDQRDVVKRIQHAFAENDSILERVGREITLLQEFRKRLVADVVTGQVDVRAIAATLPDAPESFDNTDSATDDDVEEALSEGEE